MNFALGLAAGKIRGVKVDAAGLAGGALPAATSSVASSGTMASASTDTSTKLNDAQQVSALLENSLLAGDVSKQTHDTICKQLEDPKISQRRLDDPSVRPTWPQ